MSVIMYSLGNYCLAVSKSDSLLFILWYMSCSEAYAGANPVVRFRRFLT